jgi:uncharacterized Zn finger protein (UPF0148 family)
MAACTFNKQGGIVAEERCPGCGELVVEGRLNCPKCGSAYTNLDDKELERDPQEQG